MFLVIKEAKDQRRVFIFINFKIYIYSLTVLEIWIYRKIDGMLSFKDFLLYLLLMGIHHSIMFHFALYFETKLFVKILH